MADPDLELATMSTALTAFLVKEGGKVMFDEQQWRDAIEHPGKIFVIPHKEPSRVEIVLTTKVVVDG